MITIHADVVGSLLRPSELIAAQSRLAAGEIDASRFREIEDRAVCDAIALQEAAGLEVVSDRRRDAPPVLPEPNAAALGPELLTY
jgi:5-methyltetrahydropteroyltriglutamate--homocysteine methyltransferase